MLYEIIEFLRFPYEAAKRQAEASTVGQSKWDRMSIRFWKWFAWISTFILVGVPVVVWLAWKLLTN